MKIQCFNKAQNYNSKYYNSQNVVFNSRKQFRALSSDTVSFGAKRENVEAASYTPKATGFPHNVADLKRLEDLPCIYCGEPMLPASKKSRMSADISSLKGKNLAQSLNDSKKYLRGNKINVAQRISAAAVKSPKKNIQEILQQLAPEYKDALESEQLRILRNIESKYSEAFTSDIEKKLFQSILYETTQWINNESDSWVFKRKTFLDELNNILNLPVFRNRNVVKKILQDAEKMPKAFESENAFVVKYHRRSPSEISDQLFYEPSPTIEHIKPRTAGGKTEPQNLAIACACCNNFVRNCTPMPRFVDQHPEVAENIKKNLNAILIAGLPKNEQNSAKLELKNDNTETVLNCLNKLKSISAYNAYVSSIAGTFENESNEKLRLSDYIIKE